MRFPFRLLCRCLVLRPLLLIFLSPGCARNHDDAIVILTSWPESRRVEFEQAYHDWSSQNVEASGNDTSASKRLEWIKIEAWDDPNRSLGVGRPIDLLLGGPKGWHFPTEPANRFVVSSSPIGLYWRSKDFQEPSAWQDLTGPEWRNRLTIDDPRRDPITMAWAESRLDQDWFGGYAELVLIAANLRQFSPGLAAIVRGDAESTIHSDSITAFLEEQEFRSFPRTPEWVEFASLFENSRHIAELESFFQFLEAVSQADFNGSFQNFDPLAESLLADLLGSTLVDAHPELRSAWKAILAAGRPAEWIEQFQQPPPWPPASIAKLLRDPGGSELADRLAEELSPSVEARAWLMLSWERPFRPIDRSTFEELSKAAGGRLVQEPRFRAWLLGEWRAWARQRYRWIARESSRSVPTDDLVFLQKQKDGSR